MSITMLVAPQNRAVQWTVTLRSRAVLGLVAVALTALAVAAAPNVWPGRPGGSRLPQGGGGITSMSVVNAAQGLSASFGLGGATVRADGARFTLGLTAFGRGAQVIPVAPVQPQLADGIIRYAYSGAVTGTWRNGALGLEQGFVLSQRPAGGGPLTVAMTAPAGAELVGGAVWLPGGLSYAGLRVADARGRVLHSWLALQRGQLLIKVSDRAAKYPVRIDPVVQRGTLTASDGAVGDDFGSSVAISGHTLVVGAPGHEVNSVPGEGAVYVFSDASGRWKRTAELTADTGAKPDESLGTEVAISGNTIVASAPYAGTSSQGALYVFTNGSGGWKQDAVLIASDAGLSDQLGHYSVAIQGKTIVAGSPAHAVHSVLGQGAVYVWNEPAGGWASMSQSAELTDAHGAEDDFVGWSVGISGSTIVAGSPATDAFEGGHHSAVFVFTKRSGHWRQTAELHQRDVATNDDIGQTVVISGHTILAATQGEVYVFRYAKGKWTQNTVLGDSDGDAVAFDGSGILASSDSIDPKKSGTYPAAIVEYREFSGKWRQVSSLSVRQSAPAKEAVTESLASTGKVVVAGLYSGDVAGSVAVLKGGISGYGPLIGSVRSGGTEAGLPVTCELPAHSTCRVTVGVRRAGSKQVLGHAKPKNIRGTEIKTIAIHFNAAFERMLAKHTVKVTFTVREYSHGKRKASGTETVTFIAE